MILEKDKIPTTEDYFYLACKDATIARVTASVTNYCRGLITCDEAINCIKDTLVCHMHLNVPKCRNRNIW